MCPLNVSPLSLSFIIYLMKSTILKFGSVMEVHHPVFYVSLGHMQNMRSSVKLKLTLTLTLTLTDTGALS